MADFLSRLASRALGVAPVARPVVAPVFAPGPRMEAQFFTPAPRRATIARAQSPSPLPPHTAFAREEAQAPPRVPARVETREPAPEKSEAATATRAAATRVIVARGEALGIPQPSPQPSPPRPSPTTSEPGEIVRVSALESIATEDRHATRPSPGELQPERPAGLDSSGPVARRAESPPQPERLLYREEPAVEVNIGRIEVRAVFPEPQAAPVARSAAPTALSLSDYLSQRDRGAR